MDFSELEAVYLPLADIENAVCNVTAFPGAWLLIQELIPLHIETTDAAALPMTLQA